MKSRRNMNGFHSIPYTWVFSLTLCVCLSQSVPAVLNLQNQTPEILVRRFSNSTGEIVPKIFKLTQNGTAEAREPSFTLKSNPVQVQSDFKTVDINILNRQKDRDNAKKIALIQEDLQSRIKKNIQEPLPEKPIEDTFSFETINPEEMIRKQARVKEDIESRLLHDEFLSNQQETDNDDMYHYPVKRSDDDYYADEPISDSPLQPRMTTEAAKEEESFFSIFESLFGSSDGESQSKKKEKPNDEPMLEEPEDENIKDNIKTISEIFKPLKPAEETEHKLNPTNQNEAPEFRIVNNFHSSQTHKPYKSPQTNPNYNKFYTPMTQRPYLHYKPYATKGYEDYDLEEFLDKKGSTTTTRVKYVSPLMTSSSYSETPPNPTTTTMTATSAPIKTSTKNINDNKVKFPSVQKKNDYFNRIKYQEVKTESTKRHEEKESEKPIIQQEENKASTENRQTSQSNKIFEEKENEVKPQKIQESPNFYNLINLPVRYSTKDTAIPLISTSYANTKIQGTGAHKYEKKPNGKYPNHKYDHINAGTSKKPNYWGVKQISTEKTVTSFKQTPITSKTTIKYFSSSDLEKLENDEEKVGLGPAFGGYGNKKNFKTKPENEPTRPTITTITRDRISVGNSNSKVEEVSQRIHPGSPEMIDNKTTLKELPKTSEKPFSNTNSYEDYDYETAETQAVKLHGQGYPNYSNYEKDQQHKYEQFQHHYQNIPLKVGSESIKQSEVEYEYYDYEVDTLPTTTTGGPASLTSTITTTTARTKFKYSELPKDKLKSSSSEKVAVIVPTQNFSYYTDNNFGENKVSSTTVTPSIKTTAKTATGETTINPTELKSQTTTPAAIKHTERESSDQIVKNTILQSASNSMAKEPAPVFENTEESGSYASKPFSSFSVLKITTQNTPIKTESTQKPVVVTASNIVKDSVINNINKNVELIPYEENIKKQKTEATNSKLQPALSVPTSYHRPGDPHQSNYDFTTEFTLGAVQGMGHLSTKKTSGNGIQFQAHIVTSSISKNSYENDEPFRPIPKPVGFSNLPVKYEDVKRESTKNSFPPHSKPTVQMPLNEKDNEPAHESHEFIPSPQFHRPVEPKPAENKRPFDVDYDFEGIQTEPKPGQYVIFSKPQLNPEMSANQLRKKEEVNGVKKIVSSVPHYHEQNISSQKHVIFNPKEGQFYQTMPNLSISEKVEQSLPIHGSSEVSGNDQLSLQLMPPRGLQTEKPFEGNFLVPDSEKKENIVSYPRPHWEKNSKPSFLMNSMSSKNDMIKHPPPHMAPTLIPPSNLPPQRFRRPIQPHSPFMRKNFNEATNNVKPKLNLPNILPQFRPNTKINSGSYHRTFPYGNSNRRNGMNVYYEKEHGNFPYHIHHPDKDIAPNREYEMGPEIVPKFITNRGKLPSELWSSQGMQKRFGQSPTNAELKLEHYPTGHSGEHPKILKRLQRTPVTTLQMLKHTPGIKTQKTQLSREDNADPLAPLVPPIYKTFPDDSKKEENVYVVYPAKAPQKLQPDNNKVIIVSDTKSQKHFYNYSTNEEQHPSFHTSNSKMDPYDATSKVEFPYEFIRLGDRLQMVKKQQNDKSSIKTNVQSDNIGDEISFQKYLPEPNFRSEDDKIDMNLHLQSNNQWNELRLNPEVNRYNNNNNHFRFSKESTDSHIKELNSGRPTEFKNVKEAENSAFTLGAVMHTMSETKKKGLVSSISLQENDDGKDVSQLNVNERISNGKIITVSMPLDIKEDSEEKSSSPDKYNFLAPFQASSSVATNGSNQGWTIVKHPDGGPEIVDSDASTESSTTQFNFDNFKPEFIGGFKPLYEFPEEIEKNKETTTQSTIGENISKAR